LDKLGHWRRVAHGSINGELPPTKLQGRHFDIKHLVDGGLEVLRKIAKYL